MTTGTAIHALTETTTLAEADELPLYYSATPGNRKITRANFRKNLFSTPVAGQLLQYSGTDWGGVAGSPTTDDLLKFNGTNWTNATIGATLVSPATTSTFADADFVTITQSSVAKKITRANLRKLLVDSPVDGAVLMYDSTAADWAPNFVSGWRKISSSRYTSWSAGVQTITMSNTADFAVGLPVAVFTGSSGYIYGVVTAVVANTSITWSGPVTGSTGGNALRILYVGRSSMVQQVHLLVEDTNYAVATGDILASVGHRYLKWQGATAYLAMYAATHATATSPAIKVKINGTAASSGALTLSAAAGTWVSITTMDVAQYDINYDEPIEINVTSAVAASNYLNVVLTFVFGTAGA